MKMKVLLLPLIFLFTSLTGVCPRRPREISVKVGEMVALYCPRGGGDAKVIWTSYTPQERDLSNMSAAEQRQMGVLFHRRSLVILNASENHRGNFSCSNGTASSLSWFRLKVYEEYEEKIQYPKTCYSQESCTVYCPDENVPAANTPNMTLKDIIWHKEGAIAKRLSPRKDIYYISSVEVKDHGVYTCTRSYQYDGQPYNMTITVVLDVKPKEKAEITVEIISPKENETHYAELGSMVVINCTAFMNSDFDGLSWSSGKSIIQTNNSFPVYYSSTRENYDDQMKMTASLVFKKVSKEDLTKNYTCNLQSVSGPPHSITINLAQKAHPSYVSMVLGIVGIAVVMGWMAVVYVRFKINITLFLRDTLGCHSSTSDGKSYDAFLMCYKSDTDTGLNAHDRKWLESVLEERFGYSLCLYDRDVLPGNAVAQAVLDCIEQSRRVVLVPTSPDLGPGSGLLSAIHEALVERQTRLVFIKTETAEVSKSGSFAEALQLLGEAGDCVTWKGISSMPPSSSFWKQLRYYLPAPQHPPKIRLLPLKS